MIVIFDFSNLFAKKDLTKRLNLIDELRGAAVVLMVIYHLFYSAAFLFNMDWGRAAYTAMTPIEPLIAITFISLAGVCCSLSRSNLKRGLRLIAVAVLVTLVTVLFTPGIRARRYALSPTAFYGESRSAISVLISSGYASFRDFYTTAS